MLENSSDAGFFNRCEYDYYSGSSEAPRRRVYVIQNYGGGESCIDACAEMLEFFAPKDVEVIFHRERGMVIPHTVEYLREGEVIARFTNFKADERTYSAEELIANPDLLPERDIQGFKAHYRIA